MAFFILKRLMQSVLVGLPVAVVVGTIAMMATVPKIENLDDRLAKGSPLPISDLVEQPWRMACYTHGGTYFPTAEGDLRQICGGSLGEASAPLGLIVVDEEGVCRHFGAEHTPVEFRACHLSSDRPNLALVLTEDGVEIR